MNVSSYNTKPRPTGNYPFDGIAEGQVKIPVDPVSDLYPIMNHV